jgi:hypothetical protein
LQLHDGHVTKVTTSISGYWVLTSGADGSIFMLSTSIKARDIPDVPEAFSAENQIILTDRPALKSQLSKIEDKDSLLDEMTKDKKASIARLEDIRKKEIADLQHTMEREVSKRDEIILLGRQEYSQTVKKMTAEIESIKKEHAQEAAETEVIYERKLAQELVYLQNMKQSYDEYVTHCRFDMNSFQKKAKSNEDRLLTEKEMLTEEFEKQKKTLLEYCDYVGERHKEVLKMMTETHDNQK